jgi:16S rRNA (uracil1498-N3)-methyltransferase
MHRFFAPQNNITADVVSLDEQESRHLRTVVRLRSGDEVLVFDGDGSEYLCTIAANEGRTQILTIKSRVDPRSPESPLQLTLAAALLKGDKFDLVVQKAVELGVSQVLPISTDRSDVKLAGSEKRIERWERIALEATKQCGRAKLMRVLPPATFDDLVLKSREGVSLLFAEGGGSSFGAIPDSAQLTAVVGPEGGWSDQEIEKAREAGFLIITFGGRILRAETASIVIPALLQHRFGDLN